MFCVISTALVLQGVIIVARGPKNSPDIVSASIKGRSANNQLNFSISEVESKLLHFTAKIWSVESPKKRIMRIKLKHKNKAFLSHSRPHHGLINLSYLLFIHTYFFVSNSFF